MKVYIVWVDYDNGESYEDREYYSDIIKIFKSREEALSFIAELTSDELLSLIYVGPYQFPDCYESFIEKQYDFDRDEYDYWKDAECIFFRRVDDKHSFIWGSAESWAISIREMEVEE